MSLLLGSLSQATHAECEVEEWGSDVLANQECPKSDSSASKVLASAFGTNVMRKACWLAAFSCTVTKSLTICILRPA